MTLKEIAAEAGVSVSTASRILNQKNDRAASPEVRERIRAIAEKGKYIPGRTSKIYRTHEPTGKSITCIFSRENPITSDNPFFTSLSRSFEKTIASYGYTTHHVIADHDYPSGNLNLISNKDVAGVFIIGRHNRSLIDLVKTYHENIVYAGLNPPAENSYDCVISDAYEMGKSAVNYLIQHNHTSIAYIGDTIDEQRYNGYCDALTESDLTVKDEYVIHTKTSMKLGYAAITQLLKRLDRPTAIFCMNDCLAVGALKALNDHGDRLSIISIDDIEAAAFTTPKLTTVHTPMKEQGIIAAKILMDRIQGGHSIVMHTSLPFHIMERESCNINPSHSYCVGPN